MTDPENEIIEKKVRRAVGINALRKIGTIVAEEQITDDEKAKVLNWFVRFGWFLLPGAVLLVVYAIGLI